MSETIPLLRSSPSPESLVREFTDRLAGRDHRRDLRLLDPALWPLMASRNGAPGPPPPGPGGIPPGVRHKPPPGPPGLAFAGSTGQSGAGGGGGDQRGKSDKTVLKEAVDAVVNSFAKHTHGYGRGMLRFLLSLNFDVSQLR